MTCCCRDVFLVAILSVVLGACAAQDTTITPYQWQKLLTHFCLANADNSTQLEKSDYDLIINNTRAISHCPNHIDTEANSNFAQRAWVAFPNQVLTWSDYKGLASQALYSQPLKASIATLSGIMWQLWTCDNTKNMTVTDLGDEFDGLNIGRSYAAAAFQQLSTDKNVITIEDYQKAAYDYFTSKVENDYSSFFFGNQFKTCGNTI